MAKRNDVLRYRVPDHQDSTVLLAALAEHGYQASGEFEHAATTLSITSLGERSADREQVRSILGAMHDSTLGGPELIYGPVRFEDEPGEGPKAVSPGVMQNFRAMVDESPAVPAAPEPVRLGWAPVVRAAWGLVLLVGTEPVCRLAAVEPTKEAQLVVRTLGARHVAQAALTMTLPSHRVLWLGAAADSAHALTAVMYGVSAPGRLRAGLASAGVATAFALDGLRRLRTD